MNIQELENVYAKLPQASALAKAIEKSSAKKIFLEGLLGSSAPMLFGSIASKCAHPLIFVLQDAEEAGYFYHDLTQLLGPPARSSAPKSSPPSHLLQVIIKFKAQSSKFKVPSSFPTLRLLPSSSSQRKTSTSALSCLRKTRG